MNIDLLSLAPFPSCVSQVLLLDCVYVYMYYTLGLGPRKFRSTYAELGDRSVWTDTPADKERKATTAAATAAAATGMIRKVTC